MQEKLLLDLYKVMKKDLGFLKKLNQQANFKKEAIINNNISKLSKIVKKEKQIMENIKILKEKRFQIIRKISDLYTLEEENLTYTDLIVELPVSGQKKISPILTELQDMIKRLRIINERNKLLLSEAIKINKFSFNVLLKVLKPTNHTYDRKNSFENNAFQHILDQRG